MKINKFVALMLVAAAFVISANISYSQDFKTKKTPEQRAQKHADKMKEHLSLTEEQYNQVYFALLSQAQQMKDLSSAKDTDKDARREKMNPSAEHRCTITGCFNTDQQTSQSLKENERKLN